MSPRRIARQMRPTLDTFNFWVGVAYFGLVAVVIALFFVNQATQKTVTRQAQVAAAHTAEIAATAKSRYQQCVTSIPTLNRINRFFAGVRIVNETLLENSAAALAVTAKSDPQYRTRVKNFHRLQRAAASAQIPKFPVPTPAKCRALRDSLLHQS